MASLELRNVNKFYGSLQVIHDLDLDISDGEFVVFVGPSGCGKSTLLRMIAGLEDISSGTIKIDSSVMNDVAPSKRGVSMVFQTYALYPHMSVYKNMSFGLRQARVAKDEIDRLVRSAAATLELTDYLDRSPRQLSGGQRQRVAIGRAIVRDPKVFLFDEPLSNLDAALRVQTRIEISRLHSRLGSTMIYVTHDQVEAMTLADKIVVLKDGVIEQVGSPMDLYNAPSNMFVAGFIGSPKMNFFTGFELSGSNDITIGIRPEHLVLGSAKNSLLSGTLDFVEPLGEYSLAYLRTTSGTEFVVKLPESPDIKSGETLHFSASSNRHHHFDSKTTLRISS